MAGNVGQRLVLGDAPARDVLLHRLTLAPRRQRLEAAQRIGLAAGRLDALPHRLGVDAISGRIGQPLHLGVQPRATASALEFLEQAGEQLDQVRDVADGIADLPLVQRPARPVGEARALVDLVAQPLLDQLRIADLLAHPQRHGRHLRVEDGLRRATGQVVDDLDILAASVEDLEHRSVDQQLQQRRQVQPGLGVDGGGFLRAGHLHQAQLGPIAVLAHEFGVDRDIGCFAPAPAQRGQRVGRGDQRMDLHARALTRARLACPPPAAAAALSPEFTLPEAAGRKNGWNPVLA